MEVEWHQAWALAVRRARASGFQVADAEDLAQKACILVVRRVRQAGEVRSWRGLVQRTVLGLIVDQRRRWSRERSRQVSIEDLAEEDLPAASDPRLLRDQELRDRLFLRRCGRARLTRRQIVLLSQSLVLLARSPPTFRLASVAREVGLSTHNLRKFFSMVLRRLQVLADNGLVTHEPYAARAREAEERTDSYPPRTA
jgi:DNA-directed RNA polymerase specialized sigma24 family protein